jgi:hypothetical protein
VIGIGYDEADELEYRVTEHDHNGVYAGNVDHFGLRTAGAAGKEEHRGCHRGSGYAY